MRPFLSLLFLALLVLSAPVARAEAPMTDPVDASAETDPLDRRAWAIEVRALRAAEKAELAPLAKAAREGAPGSRAQAQRALEDAKRSWRQRVLSAQLVRVRAAGLTEQAQRIELRIAELDAVNQKRVPAAPAGGDQ